MEFENELRKEYRAVQYSNSPKIVLFLIKYSGGIIRNEKWAEFVLLVMSIIVLSISAYSLIQIFKPESKINQNPVYQEDILPETLRTLPKEVLDTIPYRYEN